MSNPRNPIVRKKSILRGVLDVCRRGEGLSHWMSCVDGGLLLAVTKTHHQTQVRHDRGQDDLKTGFGFPEVSDLTNPQSHQAGNPMCNDDAFAYALLPSSGFVMATCLCWQSFFGW